MGHPNLAIFGAAGAIGRCTAAELQNRGIPFYVVGRNPSRLKDAFGSNKYALIRQADLSDLSAARRAAANVKTILYTVGLPYEQFNAHPVLMRNTVEAAARAGVERIVVVSSVYAYGRPVTPKVTESHPRDPEAYKGKMRRDQEDIALQAHRAGTVRVTVLRLPDFYGPDAELSFAHSVFQAVRAGKKATWLGSVDLPHEFIYVPDAGRAIADITARPDLDGQAWNLGGPGTITGREFLKFAYHVVGTDPHWRSVGKMTLRLAGIFNPFLRQLVELYYLHEMPVILDDLALSLKLGGILKTPYAEGIGRTLEAMR